MTKTPKYIDPPNMDFVGKTFEAFTKTAQFKNAKKIDGFTPQQRFFLSRAQIWRSNALPETTAQLILTDPHSPGMFRANGAVVNMDEWYTAFDVQSGDKLYVATGQADKDLVNFTRPSPN